MCVEVLFVFFFQISGREMFEFNPLLVVGDDQEAGDDGDVVYFQRNDDEVRREGRGGEGREGERHGSKLGNRREEEREGEGSKLGN